MHVVNTVAMLATIKHTIIVIIIGRGAVVVVLLSDLQRNSELGFHQ